MDKNTTYEKIKTLINQGITTDTIQNFKTQNGNTQNSERSYINLIKEIFNNNNIIYTEAPSQQSKDFRNINETDLNLECKKTDSTKIYFNDTCPSEIINYCIICTGTKKYPPQIIFVNGKHFIESSPWINEYIEKLTELKNKYGRGKNKKNLCGIMEVYPRPTFKADISNLLEKY